MVDASSSVGFSTYPDRSLRSTSRFGGSRMHQAARA
jgi:hypothetical protein